MERRIESNFFFGAKIWSTHIFYALYLLMHYCWLYFKTVHSLYTKVEKKVLWLLLMSWICIITIVLQFCYLNSCILSMPHLSQPYSIFCINLIHVIYCHDTNTSVMIYNNDIIKYGMTMYKTRYRHFFMLLLLLL